MGQITSGQEQSRQAQQTPEQVICDLSENLHRLSFDTWSPSQMMRLAQVLAEKSDQLESRSSQKAQSGRIRSERGKGGNGELKRSSPSSKDLKASKEMKTLLKGLRKQLLTRYGGQAVVGQAVVGQDASGQDADRQDEEPKGAERPERLEQYAESLSAVLVTLKEFPKASATKTDLWQRVHQNGHMPTVILENILIVGEALQELQVEGDIVTLRN